MDTGGRRGAGDGAGAMGLAAGGRRASVGGGGKRAATLGKRRGRGRRPVGGGLIGAVDSFWLAGEAGRRDGRVAALEAEERTCESGGGSGCNEKVEEEK